VLYNQLNRAGIDFTWISEKKNVISTSVEIATECNRLHQFATAEYDYLENVDTPFL